MKGAAAVTPRSSRPWRLAAPLLLATCGPPAPPQPAAPAPAPAPAPTPAPALALASACPLLRDAPAATPAGAAEGAGECPVLATVRAAFPRSEQLGEDELTTLRTSIEGAVADHPRACVAELGRELVAATDCGIVYDAVAIRILTSPAVDPRLAAGELLRPSPCRWKLLAALREASVVDPTIAATVSGLTADPDEDVRNAAWMTLGTLGRLARDDARPELVTCIEGQIAAELRARDGAARNVLVSAAGNAGCERCADHLHGLVASADPAQRRLGVSSLRFLPGERDVEALCRVVLTDPEASIRSAAAFALRHGASHLERRLQCLYDAAAEDPAEAVARDAVTSIAELAAGSELGIGVLVQVVRFAEQESTRGHAASALRAFATDEAILAIVNAP